ncbi:MAG: hypothetical protein HYY95_23910 [Candidatus Rokubacteria bacterium]|nr:hypothetical protein [Candidatus Rokubacteria bacterium]
MTLNWPSKFGYSLRIVLESCVGHGAENREVKEVLHDHVGRSSFEAQERERLGHALAEELDGAEGEDDEPPENRGVHEARPEIAPEETQLA